MRCLGFIPIGLAFLLAFFGKNSRDLSLVQIKDFSSLDKSREFFDMMSVYDNRDLFHKISNNKDSLKLNLLMISLKNKKIIALNGKSTQSDKNTEKNKSLQNKLFYVYGGIQSSFYHTLVKKGVDRKIINKVVHHLSKIVDFQHGMRLNDPFEILYEAKTNSQGKVIQSGDVRYIGLFTKGKIYQLYSFKNEFFNAKGESTKRSLLSTPLNPRHMKINSHFQRNRYLNGYCRDHKGIDYGAPHGSEIFAAGSGVVVKCGWWGAYGNMVKIRHSNNYETLYAHLSKIPRHVYAGARIQQGNYIGNVGATGRTTGTHLHYEVIYKGVHQNPLYVKHTPSEKLSGLLYRKFQAEKRAIDTKIVGIPRLLASKERRVF
jgi:murein DD-endopeptidase MepM/ murein hydrolase activator NlpD